MTQERWHPHGRGAIFLTPLAGSHSHAPRRWCPSSDTGLRRTSRNHNISRDQEINGAPTFDSPGSLPRMLAQEVTDIGLEYQR